MKTIIRSGCAALLLLLLSAASAPAQHGSYYGPNFYRYSTSLYQTHGPYFTTRGMYGPTVLFYPRMYSYHGANRTRWYNVERSYNSGSRTADESASK